VLEVSRSGYYAWKNRRCGPRYLKSIELLERIVQIFEASGGTYGSPRIHAQLAAEGIVCNRKTIEKLMRDNGIRVGNKRKHVVTTDSKHNMPIAPNVLDRDFEVEELDEVWVSDITYVDTAEGWLYVAVFLDLCSRKIVGWSMSADMTANLVVNAFRMGVDRHQRAPLVVHSDRGSQYASKAFRDELELHDCIQSMSRKGNCWDNAPAESFFGSMKSEHVYHHKYKTREQAKESLFGYMEIFYNKKRLHSTLNYLTPEQKEQKMREAA
jgi:transposase InsO family protein